MSIIACRYGDFSVPDSRDLIYDAMRKYGEWGQQEIDLLSQLIHPGDVVVDAGAFIGTHARAFSLMVGSGGAVHAFEPNPASHSLLLENAKLSRFANITTYQTALGQLSSSGIILPTQNNEENLGGTKLTQNAPSSSGIEVAIRPLDDFDFRMIAFIKADLEGMEYSMLLGAEKTISRDRPIIFLEANNLQASHSIIGWAHAMDYSVLGVLSDAFNPANFKRLTENMFGSARECGLLLIHQEKLAAMQNELQIMNLPVIESIDSLALFFLFKPQYFGEVLNRTQVADQIGTAEQALGSHEAHYKQAGLSEFAAQAKSNAEEIAFSSMAEVERLREQLAATEEAKGVAETLAISRLEELGRQGSQLERTAQAKSNAEEIAFSSMAEVERLRAQLAATEEAKGVAEAFAISRLGALETMQVEFDALKLDFDRIQNALKMIESEQSAIHASIGFKLLTALRLIRKKADTNA